MADIFISYSRKDKAFVQVLHQALSQSRYDAWVDWDDIPESAAWWKAIEAGIEAAHTCIFVVSPDSVVSTVCRQEIDHAAKYRKRLIPVVRREGFAGEQVHPALRELNWLFFREQDDFDATFQRLVDTINFDLEYASAHARLLVRALEWDANQRNSSFLLRGKDLSAAERWLIKAQPGPTPNPTSLQIDYIAQSRRSATARQRIMLGTLSGLLLITAGVAVVAWQQKALAEQRQQEAEANLEAACRQIFGMLDGFYAMEQHDIDFVDSEGFSVPVGIIFGQEFVRTAHNTFNTDCAQINQVYGWSLPAPH
ncbi:MAG: toll/interleukin-1 receptor domain-containing protein [Leptolyngbyaceae cyanobacterium SM2_5_2]|nr:toll/interleukin-1 receptor domain-containing protein [Leptolyngbyaceae cyanobacterium SM2_5_2]